MEQIYLECQEWCFEKQIYFYGSTVDCNEGFCRIIKWVKGIPQKGQKLFEIEAAKTQILELYKQVYEMNNKC